MPLTVDEQRVEQLRSALSFFSFRKRHYGEPEVTMSEPITPSAQECILAVPDLSSLVSAFYVHPVTAYALGILTALAILYRFIGRPPE